VATRAAASELNLFPGSLDAPHSQVGSQTQDADEQQTGRKGIGESSIISKGEREQGVERIEKQRGLDVGRRITRRWAEPRTKNAKNDGGDDAKNKYKTVGSRG